MSCIKCRAPVTSRFCSSCGADQGSIPSSGAVCSNCRAPKVGPFCTSCGHSDSAAPAASPVRKSVVTVTTASSPSNGGGAVARAGGGGAAPAAGASSGSGSGKQRKWAQRYAQGATTRQPINSSLRAATERHHKVTAADLQNSGGDNRSRVINELINTERDYIKDLETIKNVFYEPLTDGAIVNAVQHADLFANLPQLHQVNCALRDRLDQSQGQGIGDIFVEMAGYLRCYGQYVTNQEVATGTLEKLSSNRDWTVFISYCSARPECVGLTFLSFLVKPLQRICKYPLLLRELLKLTPPSHPEHASMKRACDAMAEVVQLVNEKKRDAERGEKMVEIAEKVVSPSSSFQLLSPTRRFESEGEVLYEVDQKGKKKAHYFLFNDLLLLTKKRRKKFEIRVQLPYSVVFVREAGSGEDCSFELVHLVEKKALLLTCESNEERDQLMTSMSDLISKFLEDQFNVTAAPSDATASAVPPAVSSSLSRWSADSTDARSSGASTGSPHSSAPASPAVSSGLARSSVVTRQYGGMPARQAQPAAAKSFTAAPQRASPKAPAKFSKPPPSRSAPKLSSKAQRALNRQSVLRLQVDEVAVSKNPLYASDALQTASAAGDDNDDDDGSSVTLNARFHDARHTVSMARDDVDFAAFRKELHDAFSIATPTSFLVLKCAGARIMNQADLMKKLANTNELEVEVFE